MMMMKGKFLLRLFVVACVSSSGLLQAAIINAQRQDDTVYFLFDFPARFERYSLVTKEWLEPLSLPSTRGTASAGLVDNDGVFVAYGKSVYRYSQDLATETHLTNRPQDVKALHSDGGLLVIAHSTGLYARLTSINKTDNTLINEFENYVDSLYGSSIAPSLNKIFGRSQGVSPSDITFAAYDDAGEFTTGGGSPHHGDYPRASRTWVFPDEARVVDNSGTVYSTEDLSFAGTLGGAINDIAFYKNTVPVVLRGSIIEVFNLGLLSIGSFEATFEPDGMINADDSILLYTEDSSAPNGVRINTLTLDNVNAPEPGEALDPAGQPYTPDHVTIGRDGILYVLGASLQSLFRWDTLNQQYLETIPLIGIPSYGAYSQETNTYYLAYRSGLIRKIDLNESEFSEEPFANLTGAPRGLTTTGSYVLAGDPSGAWMSHVTFDPDGTLIQSKEWNYPSREYVWSPINQKIYHFRDGTSPNDLLSEEINANGVAYPDLPPGGIGQTNDSPLHASAGFRYPIRVSPAGDVVVLGSGLMHSASNLERLSTSLANEVEDIAWLGNEIQTIRSIGEVTQYQEWVNPTFGLGTVKQYPGTANRLLALNESRLIGISILDDGIPAIDLLNEDFEIVPPPTLHPPSLSIVEDGGGVSLEWIDVSGETGYVIERQSPRGEWREDGTTGVSETSYQIPNAYESNDLFRVRSRNGESTSDYLNLAVFLTAPPLKPLELAAEIRPDRTNQLSWDDVDWELGFTIEMKVGNQNSWEEIASLDEDQLEYIHSTTIPGTQYAYRIRSFNEYGASELTYSAVVTTEPDAPSAPILSAPRAQTWSVILTWDDLPIEDEYDIERQVSQSEWVLLGTLPKDTIEYRDTMAEPGSDYSYRLKARNSVGESEYSASVSASTLGLPPVPTITVESVDEGALIQWEALGNEVTYLLERKFENESAWSSVGSVSEGATSYIDRSVDAENYQYRLAWTYGDIQSVPSNIVPFINSPPSTPPGFAVDFISSREVTLNWQIPNHATGFTLEVQADDQEGWQALADLGADDTSYSHDSRQPQTTAMYRIRSYNSIGASFYSEPLTATTLLEIPAPPIIGNAIADVREITLEWTPVALADSYELLRRDQRTDWIILESLAADVSQFVDRSVQPSTFYEYRISASNELGQSEGSRVWSATTLAVPPPISPMLGGAFARSRTSLEVIWEDVENELGYRLESSTIDGSWELAAELAANTTHYIENALDSGEHYRYRVIAWSDHGVAEPSNEVTGVPLNVIEMAHDTFDPQADAAVWSNVDGGRAINGGPGFLASNALWFGASGARNATSHKIELPESGYLEFLFRSGNEEEDGSSFWSNGDPGQKVVVEYTVNETEWHRMASIDIGYPNASAWKRHMVHVPTEASSSSVMFRWRQESETNSATKNPWALEDVSIHAIADKSPTTPDLIVAAPGSSSQISLFWGDSIGVKWYELERSTNEIDWLRVSGERIDGTSYSDSNLTASTQYFYRVRAVNDGGPSDYSSTTMAKTSSLLAAWRIENFGNAANDPTSSPMFRDRVGLTNLERFAFGMSASDGIRYASHALPTGLPSLLWNADHGRLQLEYVRRREETNPGVRYDVVTSENLEEWTATGNVESVTPISDQYERVVWVQESQIAGTQRYVRVVLTLEDSNTE